MRNCKDWLDPLSLILLDIASGAMTVLIHKKSYGPVHSAIRRLLTSTDYTRPEHRYIVLRAYSLKIQLLFEQGAHADAIDVAKVALNQIEPDDEEYYLFMYSLAHAYSHLREYEEALATIVNGLNNGLDHKVPPDRIGFLISEACSISDSIPQDHVLKQVLCRYAHSYLGIDEDEFLSQWDKGVKCALTMLRDKEL